MRFLIIVVLSTIAITCAFGLPNEAWKAQRIQAERNGDAQRLRVLDFISKAGTLRWATGGTYRASCCGKADAYEADLVETDDQGNTVAILTCNDPEDCAPVPGKTERLPGSKFRIPQAKVLVNYDPVNNTGHGWVWISNTSFNADGTPVIYCYSEPPLF